MKNQTDQILDYINLHGSISPMEALENCGCFRLASRICDLKKIGYSIQTEHEHRGDKYYARYRLIRKSAEQLQFA